MGDGGKDNGGDMTIDDKVNEMHSDVKVLVTEFKNMNGELRDTKQRFDKHEEESVSFRTKVTELWAGVHFSKWVIGLMVGSSMLYHIVVSILKK